MRECTRIEERTIEHGEHVMKEQSGLDVRNYSILGAVQRKKIREYYGSSRYHSEFFGENHPKIALNQYRYFGVVYHYVFCLYIYIVKSC